MPVPRISPTATLLAGFIFLPILTQNDIGSKRRITDRFSANLFGNQAGSHLFTKGGTVTKKSSTMDLKSLTDIASFSEPRFYALKTGLAPEAGLYSGSFTDGTTNQ